VCIGVASDSIGTDDATLDVAIAIGALAVAVLAAVRRTRDITPRREDNMNDHQQTQQQQAELENFIRETEEGVRHQVQGDSEPLLALWSQAQDIAILGAIGTYARGWDDVRTHILGAARSLNWTTFGVERLVTQKADGLAVSVILEHMTRETGDPLARTLRVTHAYRLEQGQWRLILRHANPVTPEAEAQERSLLGH
jgi:hypothetical protein